MGKYFWGKCVHCGFTGTKEAFSMIGLKGGLCKKCQSRYSWRWTEKELRVILNEGVRKDIKKYSMEYIRSLPDKMRREALIKYRKDIGSEVTGRLEGKREKRPEIFTHGMKDNRAPSQQQEAVAEKAELKGGR